MKKNPHARLFSHYPLLQLALAYSAGVIVSSTFTFQIKWLLLVTGACSLCVVASLALRKPRLCGVALLLAFMFAGATLCAVERNRTHEGSLKQLLTQDVIVDSQSVKLTGVLLGPAEFGRDRVYLTLRVEEVAATNYKGPATGVVSLMATFKTPASKDEYRELDLSYGSRIQVIAVVNRLDKYRNPGVSTITEYLDRKNYDATGVVKNPGAIVKLGETNVFRPLLWLYAWRATLQDQFDQNFSPETAGVLDAALLGNRYNLTRATGERFREAGTFHVLVISGLHISFIGALVFLLVRRITRRRLAQFVVSNLVVWAYTLAVGAEASVVRASLMFTFVTLGAVVFRQASALNSLGSAALLLLIKEPKDLFDPSLQLTFLSVLAIVTIAWPLLQNLKAIGGWHPTSGTPYPPDCHPLLKTICECLYWSERHWLTELALMPHEYRLFKSPLAARLERTHLQRPLRYIMSSVIVSLSVQVVLLPFMVVYFHRVSVSSIALNIVVSLLLALLSGVALSAVLLNQLSGVLAQPLFKVANMLDWIMTHSVDPFMRFGISSLRVAEYSGRGVWVYVVYFVPLIFLMMCLSRWQPLAAPGKKKARRTSLGSLAAVAQFSLLAIVLFHPLSAGRPDGKLHIDFLDVGQGDSALITMPDGSTLLVDGGGHPTFFSNGSESIEHDSRSVGEMVVAEYLWWRGLDSVDYVLATHADADHIDGLNDVVRNFSVRCALVGRQPNDDPEFRKFAETLKSRGTPLEVIGAGDELQFGEVGMKVLWPTALDDPRAASGNNDSVVLLIKFGERAILLTGDIEKETEARVVATNKELRVDLVKVAHHGSRTSSTVGFVAATSPRFAVVSVGRTSIFGHPHPEVVERWQQIGAEVLTTGKNGTISVTTDGKQLWLTTFVKD
jgi:competence protein ComEC